MKVLTLQPTFTVEVELQGVELMRSVRRAIQSPELRDHVRSAGACIDIAVESSQRRFWSPHLNVEVSDAEGGSELFCRFSPRPEVWTMVMMIYFVATFIITGSAIYGYVQWFLGQTPWSLVVIPTAALVIVTLHLASLIGQGLSSDQMETLRRRLELTLELALADQDVGRAQPAGDYRVDEAAEASEFKPRSAKRIRVSQSDADEQLQ